MERKLLVETVELLNNLGNFKVLDVEQVQELSVKISDYLKLESDA
tara:strand:+ start:579 stop:713 length:135 start_codon:yes stop_codon:yes gene_type:complete